MDIEESINDAVKDISDEIKILQERRDFLHRLNLNSKITEDEWHELCLSSLRTSDILADVVKNIFPSATNVSVGANYVYFYINDLKCYLPTSAIRGIEIDVDWYTRLEEPKLNDNNYKSQEHRKLERYMNATNWDEKSKIIIGRYKKWVRFILWNIRYRFNEKSYKKQYEEYRDKLEISYKNRLESYEKRLDEQIKMCKKIKETVLPELYTFTSNINAYKQGTARQIPPIEVIINQYLGDE